MAPSFYLIEVEAMHEVIAEFDRRLNGRAPDEVIPAVDAQHIADLPLLKALLVSPRRTMNKSAAHLFVVGAAPTASEVLGRLEGLENSTNSTERHLQRMHAVAQRLKEDECWAKGPFLSPAHCWASVLPFAGTANGSVRTQAHNGHKADGAWREHGRDRHATPASHTRITQVQKPYLLLATGILLDYMLGNELQNTITTPGSRVILASIDPSFANVGVNLRAKARYLLGNALTIPYWAHHYARAAVPSQQPALLQLQDSGGRAGVLFHGGTRRYDYGVRLRTESSLKHLRRYNTTPVDLRIGEMTRGEIDQLNDNWAAYMSSGASFGSASLCMSPSGDTITSRRTFDALSGGCVPVLVRSSFLMELNGWDWGTCLPFPSTIDWPRIALRLLAKKGWTCEAGAARWLDRWHNGMVEREELEAMRRRGMSAFNAHLDYERNPQGVLSALLREVLLNRRPIVPTCQLETVYRPTRATAWTCRPRRDEEIDQHLLASISNIEHGPLS